MKASGSMYRRVTKEKVNIKDSLVTPSAKAKPTRIRVQIIMNSALADEGSFVVVQRSYKYY